MKTTNVNTWLYFKAVQVVNEKLTKVKEGFLIDFTSRLHNFFYDQAMFHW